MRVKWRVDGDGETRKKFIKLFPSSNYGLCGVLSKSPLLVTPSFSLLKLERSCAVAVVCRVTYYSRLRRQTLGRDSRDTLEMPYSMLWRDTFDMSIYSIFSFHFRLAEEATSDTPKCLSEKKVNREVKEILVCRLQCDFDVRRAQITSIVIVSLSLTMSGFSNDVIETHINMFI